MSSATSKVNLEDLFVLTGEGGGGVELIAKAKIFIWIGGGASGFPCAGVIRLEEREG